MGKSIKSLGRFNVFYLFILVVLICTETACSKQKLVLSKEGVSNAVIVISDQASPAERQAAGQLKHYLDKVSSGNFPIKKESEITDKGNENLILIGQTNATLKLIDAEELKNLGQDGVIIKTIENTLILTGEGNRGTLYSVYTFLEEYVGCKWWAPGDQTIPSMGTISLNPISYSYHPQFTYRSHYIYNLLKDPELAVSLHENGDNLPLTDEWGGQLKILGWVHTFSTILPPAKYFSSHPEWYSDPSNHNLPSTSRTKLPDPQATQLCMSNEKMQNEFLKNTLKWIEENPSYSIISVSQNDNKEYCHCDKCNAIVAQEGSAAGLLLRFVNKIARGVKLKHPDKSIETLAYYFSEKPPGITKPDSNVIIRFAPIDADFAYALDAAPNQNIKDNIQEWAKISGKNFFWGYNTNINLSLMPHPSLYHFQQDLNFLAKNNFKGIFIQDNTNPEGYGYFTAMQAWIVGKLMWNPDSNYQELLNEFTTGYYGAAGVYMKSYFLLMQDALLKNKSVMGTFNTDFSFITPEILEKGRTLFEKAHAAVKDNTVLSARVKKEENSFSYTRLYMFSKFAPAQMNQIDKQKEYDLKITSYFSGLENMPVADQQVDYALKGYRSRLRDELKQSNQATANSKWVIQQDQFDYVDFGGTSSIVSDPEASDQSAAAIDGKTNDWAARVLVGRAKLDNENSSWEVNAFIKAKLFKDKAINKETIISFGVFDTETKKYIGMRDLKLSELVSQRYKKITIGNINLNGNCVIFFSVNSKNKEVSQLLIDKVELVKQ